MVTKEPKEYYWLRGEYLFRNLITGREALLCDYSRPTTHKCQGKELEILREEMIDRCLKLFAFELRNNKKECISQYVLVEIIKEEWQKL